MGNRIHPQPGEPYCDYCHGGGDDSLPCSQEHTEWFMTEQGWQVPPKEDHADAIRAFTNAILHGDESHREWLKRAAEQFILDGTVPEED